MTGRRPLRMSPRRRTWNLRQQLSCRAQSLLTAPPHQVRRHTVAIHLRARHPAPPRHPATRMRQQNHRQMKLRLLRPRQLLRLRQNLLLRQHQRSRVQQRRSLPCLSAIHRPFRLPVMTQPSLERQTQSTRNLHPLPPPHLPTMTTTARITHLPKAPCNHHLGNPLRHPSPTPPPSQSHHHQILALTRRLHLFRAMGQKFLRQPSANRPSQPVAFLRLCCRQFNLPSRHRQTRRLRFRLLLQQTHLPLHWNHLNQRLSRQPQALQTCRFLLAHNQ